MAIDAKQFEVVRKPILTEKTANQQAGSVYCFEIAGCANKIQVRTAVEAIWNVKVATVRTVNTKGEQKRNRFGTFQTTGLKKAYVKLKPGYEIEIA